MDIARTALRESGRRGVLGGLAVSVAVLISGCDSVVGIPGDEPEPAATQPTSTTTTGANTGGDTPEPPAVSQAITRWAADLRTGNLDELEQKCWTMAPLNVRAMYAEPAPILAALDQPSVGNGSSTVWKSAAVTVIANDRELATDYACPRVFATGTTLAFNDADARHTVRRYLSRLVGEPVAPTDAEGTYPLVCAAEPGSWDPNGTGSATTAPLAVDPDASGDVTAFIDQSLESEWPRGDYITVSATVTNAAGGQQKRTFTLKSGEEGYCIGDVSA